MEHVLKAVPADLRVKMEALVHDLTLALEESNSSANVRRRWGIRRRARSTGNIPSLHMTKQSDDSSSSICDIHIPKNTATSKYQSDSDDTNQTKRFAHFSNSNNASNIESDSVNENFVPRVNPKLAMSTAFANKKRVLRSDCKNRYETVWCGKRKRSCRERSTDCGMRSLKPNRTTKSKNRIKMQTDDPIDCSRISSSSISSSDSETGLITNDEDREGDDEQSDWIGEPSWWNDNESTNEDKVNLSSPLQMMLHGNFEHTTVESRKNYRKRIQRIRDWSGREIRAGRRRVDNKPGYSIITSANEKVSRFLQDPTQSELRLHPMRQHEREKLRRLANLYSLSLKGDLGCPILYKTRHTTQAICVDQVSFNRFSGYKRLRRTPPKSELMVHSQENQISTTKYDTQIINPSPNIDKIPVLPEFSHYKWDTNSMDIEIHGKPKLHDFDHSKSS